MSSHVSQICYATRDVEATARALAAIDGVGPFFVGEFEHRDVTYRNRKIGTSGRSPSKLRSAIATTCNMS